MTTHPVHDLIKNIVLGARVSEQVEQLDRRFSSLNNVVETLIGLMDTIIGHILVDVSNIFTVKLVMETFESVAEVSSCRLLFVEANSRFRPSLLLFFLLVLHV